MAIKSSAAIRTLRTYTMVIALLCIWGIFQYATDGSFLQARNLSNLLTQMAVTGSLSVAMVLVIVAAQIDLSLGSVVCFLGAIVAVFNTTLGYSPSVVFLITLAAGAIIGAIQGYLVSYQRIPAFIVTLGGMMIFRGSSMWLLKTSYVSAHIGWVVCVVALALSIFSFIRRDRAQKRHGLKGTGPVLLVLQITGLSALVLGFMSILGSYEGIPVPVFIMVGLMVIVNFAATKTTWGRHIYAIGGNREAAHLSGINTRLHILSVFILMGVLAAIGGIILTARVGSASPDAGQLLELDAIASCVIGGTSLMGGIGSIPGALLGALVMESLNNGMSLANMEPFWQYIVKGGVLVIAVWFDIISQEKKS